MDDKHDRTLIDPANRINIYRQLNLWNLSVNGDNCPAAADALFHYLGPRRPGQQTSITRALPPNSAGFVYEQGVSFVRANLLAIISLVRQADPGFVVVVHGVRPQGALVNGQQMAPDHYFCIVKLGPPENDAFWADCSRPNLAIFYPSNSQTPGTWYNTIQGMANHNKLQSFEYTTGPFGVRVAP